MGPEPTRWVMAFDRETGRRAAFTICPERLVPYHRELYLIDGYLVEVLTEDEVDARVAAGTADLYQGEQAASAQ